MLFLPGNLGKLKTAGSLFIVILSQCKQIMCHILSPFVVVGYFALKKLLIIIKNRVSHSMFNVQHPVLDVEHRFLINTYYSIKA
jgi:hypothetical protein